MITKVGNQADKRTLDTQRKQKTGPSNSPQAIGWRAHPKHPGLLGLPEEPLHLLKRLFQASVSTTTVLASHPRQLTV